MPNSAKPPKKYPIPDYLPKSAGHRRKIIKHTRGQPPQFPSQTQHGSISIWRRGIVHFLEETHGLENFPGGNKTFTWMAVSKQNQTRIGVGFPNRSDGRETDQRVPQLANPKDQDYLSFIS